MASTTVIERIERVVATRVAVVSGDAVVDDLRSGLVDIRDVRAFLDATEASIVSALTPAVSFPEADVAEASRGSLGGASKTVERADTLVAAPRLADALEAAAITAGHVDALTRVGKGLDAGQSDPAGGPVVDWPIAVEVPPRVLASMIEESGAQPVGVVVRNGVVIHAPGELNLGRTTRLANRAQRRALRGLYAACAVPGCAVHYDRCKLHHVVWWPHGGRTDLDNLLPLCSAHHHAVHDAGWEMSLGRHRELTIRFPDGSIRTTGPPSRRAA